MSDCRGLRADRRGSVSKNKREYGCEIRNSSKENVSKKPAEDTLCSKIPSLADPQIRCGDRASCKEEEPVEFDEEYDKPAEIEEKSDLKEKTDDFKLTKAEEQAEVDREGVGVGLGSRCSWLAPLDQDEVGPPPPSR